MESWYVILLTIGPDARVQVSDSRHSLETFTQCFGLLHDVHFQFLDHLFFHCETSSYWTKLLATVPDNGIDGLCRRSQA